MVVFLELNQRFKDLSYTVVPVFQIFIGVFERFFLCFRSSTEGIGSGYRQHVGDRSRISLVQICSKMETFESEHSFMKKSKSRYTNYYLLGGGFQDQPGCSVQTSGRVSFQTRAFPSPSCQYYTVLPSDPRRPSGFIVGSYNCSFAAYLKVPTF